MQIVQIFDPGTQTGDTFSIPQSSASGKFVIWNESNINLQIALQNGHSAYVPAWTAVKFCGYTGNVNVTWQQQTVLQATSAPISQVVVVAYESQEDPGTFPMALTRQSNVGNAIVNVSTATALVNDGNAAPQTIVEATVSGDAQSAVKLTNNGVLTLGSAANHGSVSFDNAGITSDGSGNISKVGNVISSGFLSMGTGAGQQTLSNNSTITIASAINIVLMTATTTGLIMPMGTYPGQIVSIANRTSFTGTFAVHTTSNVINGQGVTIPAFGILMLLWIPSDNNQWFPVVSHGQ